MKSMYLIEYVKRGIYNPTASVRNTKLINIDYVYRYVAEKVVVSISFEKDSFSRGKEGSTSSGT